MIPAPSEAASIEGVVNGCPALADARKIPCEVIVVDEESDDGTAARVEAMGRAHPGARLIRRGTRGRRP